MTTPLLSNPIFYDSRAPSGQLFTYIANSTTPQVTYSDAAGTVPNTNPVQLDTTGAAIVRLGAGLAYDFVLKDQTGTTTIDTINNYVQPLYSVSLTQAVIAALLNPQTSAESAAGVTPTNLQYLQGDVRRYGAVGDGVTNDAPAFAKALLVCSGLTVYVPDPPVAWLINSALTALVNTTIQGSNKRTCKILCGGNFDLLTLNDGACMFELYLEGNATTGHGVNVLSAANNQTIQNCRIINFAPGTAGGALNFADNTAGSRISVHDVEVWQTNGTTGSGLYAIYIPDVISAPAVPRKFSHIETSGNASFFFGGCDDIFITGSFLADLKYSSNSRSVQISASRVANAAVITIDGANHSWVGVDTFPQLILASTLTNSKIDPGSTNIGLTTFNTITALTAAAAAVATVSTVVGTNPFKVGTKVFFDSVGGMTQINGLYGNVTAIGGASGAWTVTTDINSGAFSAFTSGGNLSAPAVVDLTGANTSVQVYQQRQIYNPALSSTGTAPTLGSGSTLQGYFSRSGAQTFVAINLTIGSGFNPGTGGLQFSLPVAKQDGEVITSGTGYLTHSGTQYPLVLQIPGNVGFVTMSVVLTAASLSAASTITLVTGTVPVTLGTGDTIRVSFSYEP